MSTAVALGIGAVILLLVIAAVLLLARSRAKAMTPQASAASATTATPAAPDSAPSSSADTPDLLVEAKRLYYGKAFGVTGFETDFPEAHRQVVLEVQRSLTASVEQDKHLPRRPMLIPQLLRALNDEGSTRDELADIILQDPVLAADVLKIANSPYYRITREAVDSIDRAIVLLGTEGLKSVVAASILQPVFRTAKGQFEAFATTLWDLGMRTSRAAGIYATRTRIADPFTAQLLGLLSALGPLAVFRVTSEVYRNHSSIRPRAEVYIHLIETEADTTSVAIAANWQLPDTFVLALSESRGTGQIDDLSPLGRILEAGRCCALLSLAPASNQRTILANKAAMAMGLETTAFDAVWSALNAAQAGPG